jgi:hypothetical protein
MTCPPYMRDALAHLTICEETPEGIWVATQLLYPSNGAVSLLITGGPNGCIVSDEGRAIEEIALHGLELPESAEPYLRQFYKPQGLRVIDGSKICSPPVAADALPAAIALTANTSSRAAFWAVKTLRPRRRRDLREELRNLFGRRYSRERVTEEVHLSGESGRLYKFEFRIEVGVRSLIVDGVFPDATAINTRAIAHLDLARMKNAAFIQRMVYDEHENWKAEDMRLLRLAAALVPLSQFGRNLDSIGA